MVDVVVIGAGISGAATAYELATAGTSVMLLDRWGPAAMASGWTLAGVRALGRDPAEWPLAQAAIADWEGLAEKLDAPTHYRQDGNIRLARTEADMARLTEMVARQSRAGLPAEMLDGAALRDVAPAVAPEILGAAYCPTDGHADPHAAVAAFVAASERAGAVLRFGEAVISIEVEGERVTGVVTGTGRIACERVVVAAGVLGNRLLEPHGVGVPMTVRAVTVLRTAPVAPVLAQVIGVADASCAGRQEVDGRFRFTSGGGPWAGPLDWPDERPAQGRARPGPRLLPPVREVARVAGLFGALVPAALEAPLDESWVGLIDMTPDALPVIEATDAPRGLVIALGFSGHGFCLGPATGRILAALAREERPNLPIEAFARARFHSHENAVPMTLHG
jgi:sarcosine oxidase, subunit beta